MDWTQLADFRSLSLIELILRLWPLCLAATAAGFVDSIGGGGGLITVPTLLNIGVPAPLLLGTNKCLSTIGSLPALIRYARAGLIPPLPRSELFLFALATALFSAWGASVSQLPFILTRLPILVPILLSMVMVIMLRRWFWVEPRRRRQQTLTPQDLDSSVELHKKMKKPLGRALLAAVGFYDGLFGPGTGSFFLNVFESMGLKTITANAITKIFNFASNIGALLYLSSQGRWLPLLGVAGGACYLVGNYVGAGLVLKRGQNVIRVIVLLATGALLLKHISRYL